MIACGIGAIMDVLLLIYSAYIGDKVFQPIYKWYYSFNYSTTPPIDPGIVTWIPAIYYGMLLGMFFALIFAMYLVSISYNVNEWGA